MAARIMRLLRWAVVLLSLLQRTRAEKDRAREWEGYANRLSVRLKEESTKADSLQAAITVKDGIIRNLETTLKEQKEFASLLSSELKKANEATKCLLRLREMEETLLRTSRELLKAQEDLAQKSVELEQLSAYLLSPWVARTLHNLQVTLILKVALRPITDSVSGYYEKVSLVLWKAWILACTFSEPVVLFVKPRVDQVYQSTADLIGPYLARILNIVKPYLKVVKESVDVVLRRLKAYVAPALHKLRNASVAVFGEMQGRVTTVFGVFEEGGEFHVSGQFLTYLGLALLILTTSLAIVITWPCVW